MPFVDRETFEFLGAAAGFLGLFVSIGSVWYARRQALAAEGPHHPHIEVAETSWNSGNDGWLRVVIHTRNQTSESWDTTEATLRSPRHAVLIAGHLITEYDSGGNQVATVPTDLAPFSATTKPWTFVKPLGSGARYPQSPSADQAREDFYLKIPAGVERFTMEFTLSRKSGIGRPVRQKVIGVIPSK